jgi:hypothetical protein
VTTYPDLDNYEQLTDEVYKYLDRLWKFEVENDSEMAADDQYLEPVKRTSQEYVWQLLGSAIDHLRLVGESGQRQQESNPFAFCTLIRTAITTASTALWILGADDRATRRNRILQVVAADYASYIRFRDTVKQGMSTPEEAAAFDREGDILDERTGWIIAEYVAPTAKRRTTLRQVEGEVSDTAMVKSAGALLDASQFAGDIDQGVELDAAWQLLSGYAHGRPWAYQAAKTTSGPESPDGTAPTTISGQDWQILGCAALALALIRLAFERAEALSRT